MKRITLLVSALVLLIFSGCKKNEENLYKIQTSYGDIVIRLYEDTPEHKKNFEKLVKEDFYEDLLFHRVINGFMIQGGDPTSKNAPKGKVLGEEDAGYTLPAEFDDSLFHKKGVIAAAREGDKVNPEKKSSGSQFYIVQGKKFTYEELNQMEDKLNIQKQQKFFSDFIRRDENKELREKIDSLQKIKDIEALKKLSLKLKPMVDSAFTAENEKFAFSNKQRKIYTEIGGTPHLDGAYTVFGEIIEGLNVIDSIAKTKTDNNNRPLDDIIMDIDICK